MDGAHAPSVFSTETIAMYEKMTLPNGVRIVYEHMAHVRSAAIGVWVGVGSRYEKAGEAGSAHFIEHMLFKGTAQHLSLIHI